VQDGTVDPAVLPLAAVLTLNEEEARTLAGGADPALLRSLGVAEVVLTLGSRGAVVVTPESETSIAPGKPSGPVDPTGAGDAFALVYLDGRARGAEPVEAARRASAVVAELISRP
jgi:ribokinase